LGRGVLVIVLCHRVNPGGRSWIPEGNQRQHLECDTAVPTTKATQRPETRPYKENMNTSTNLQFEKEREYRRGANETRPKAAQRGEPDETHVVGVMGVHSRSRRAQWHSRDCTSSIVS